MSNFRRSVGLSLIVMVSILLPIGVTAWSFYVFVTSATEPFEYAILKEGQLWYPENRSSGLFTFPQAQFSCELKSIAVATGTEKPTGIKLEDDYATPMLLGGELYLVAAKGIYQLEKSDTVTSGSSRHRLKFISSYPVSGVEVGFMEQAIFVYQGEFTTLIEAPDGVSRLMHLRDGRWVDGRGIRLPPLNCSWYVNPVDGRKMFKPMKPAQAFGSITQFTSNVSPVVTTTSVPVVTVTGASMGVAPVVSKSATALVVPAVPVPDLPIEPVEVESMGPPAYLPPGVGIDFDFAMPTVPGQGQSWTIQVQQQGDRVHVLCVSMNGFCAYRNGFEFDDLDEGVSALEAENIIRDANGWIPVPYTTNGYYIQRMASDRYGVLFSTTNGLIRRLPSGDWTTVNHAEHLEPESIPRFIIDSAEETLYVIGKAGNVLRVEESSLQPTDFRVPDYQKVYLARWKWLFAGLAAAWLLHQLLVTAGTGIFLRTENAARYEFGNQSALLASPGRRGFALGIDVALFATILLISSWAHSRILGFAGADSHRNDLVNILRMTEESLMYLDWDYGLQMLDSILEVASYTLFDHENGAVSSFFMVIVIVAIDTGIAVWGLKILDEGRYGTTPGKRLLGIRTVRTTLRNAGFARTLMRDTFYWIDLLGFITPLPAAASLIFSSNRQRWGDKLADTIVINANSPVCKLACSQCAIVMLYDTLG